MNQELTQNQIEIRAWAKEQNRITREKAFEEKQPKAEELLKEDGK